MTDRIDGSTATSNGSIVSYSAAFEPLEVMAGEEATEGIANTLSYTRLLRRHGVPDI